FLPSRRLAAPAWPAVARRTPRWPLVRPMRRPAGLLAQQSLARQLDPILIVDGDDLDLHDVANLANVLDLVHVLVVELADMAQAVAAGQDLDESAEVLDGGDPAFVDLADAHFFGKRLDLGAGGLGAFGVEVGDVDCAVVVDVDLGAGGLLDALDRL